jgi:uncharacterized protein (DUF1684 family)
VTSGIEALAVVRERRNLAATAPQGPLALTNTQWIDTEQTIWGVPGSWGPRTDGGSGLVVTASAKDQIVVDGALVEGSLIVRGKDDDAPSAVVFSDTVSGHVIAGEAGYALRVWDTQSEGIQRFGAIDAFDHNEAWVITGAWTEIPGGTSVGFEHLKDEGVARDEVVPGEIRFTHEGTEYSIAAFKAGRALQLVFSDATNGDSTYSVGRFLFLAPNPDGTITLDFNYAILPPCAFSYAFNCPLPPAQNRFPFAIEAGEKNVLEKDGSLLHG